MKRWIDASRLTAFVVALGLIFYGSRYLNSQPVGFGLVIAGFVLMALSIALSALGIRTADGSGERASRFHTIYWKLLVAAGLGLYFAYAKVLGTAAEPESNGARILLAAWVVCLILGFAWGFGTEWAFRASGRGRFAEPKRVQRAGNAWVLVGLLLCSIVALNYVAVRKNRSWDWSYLKTAKVSESTAKVLGSLDKDLRVGLFFAPTNEVTSHVRSYFDALPQKDSHVKVEYYDTDLNPNAAEEFKASRNGQVVLKFGDASERIEFGATLSSARKTLRNLDAEFQKALLAATQKRKVLYFTRGHGELTWTGSDVDPMKSIKLLEGFLRGQNYTLRFFGVGEGSTKTVPEDADAVVVLGGSAPMLAEEATAIDEFVGRGGALLAMLDLDTPNGDTILGKDSRDTANDPFLKMLAEHGVRYTATPVGNETNIVSATKGDVDHWFIFTNTFTSHESVAALARNDQRAAVLVFKSGYLQTTSELSGWQTFDTVRALSDSFADENRDFKFNEAKEKRNAYVLGAATILKDDPSKKDLKRGKIVTFADANAASDLIVRNQGNLVYVVEALRWLVGDIKGAAGSGVATTEEDVRIQHTRKEDIAWFYGTVALIPLLVLGVGFAATRRAKRKR